MTKLTVRVKNVLWDRRKFYAYPIPEFVTYTGEVYPRPRWVSEDQFCLTTGDPDFPFRVIDRDRIVDGWLLPETKTQSISVNSETFNVKKYLITRNGDRWSCDCVGFGYRKTCSHLKEAQEIYQQRLCHAA